MDTLVRRSQRPVAPLEAAREGARRIRAYVILRRVWNLNMVQRHMLRLIGMGLRRG
jgi:hypothetical protein